MKSLTSIALSAGVAVTLFFTSCSKDETVASHASGNSEKQSMTSARTAAYSETTSDRIDAIMKDLSLNSYSLSFEKAIPSAGITRTAYGADNYLAFADPQNLKCPDPIKYRYRRIPIWKRPVIVWPTCPDMAIDIDRLRRVKELLVNADQYQFGGLQEVGLLTGGGFLATEKFTGQFAAMKLDRIDEITKDLSHEKFLMLNQPGNYSGGFTRSFYGFADLNSIVFKPYKRTINDVFKPTLKGCFDPIILSTIKERLQRMDPATYKYLNVTPLPENRNIAVLSM